jgi:hypothetical protein
MGHTKKNIKKKITRWAVIEMRGYSGKTIEIRDQKYRERMSSEWAR